MNIPWWTTPRVIATTAVVGLVGGLGSATAAVTSLAHTRRDARSRSRPMMSAELKISGKLYANLVIKNSGASIARDVHVTFDPPLPTDAKARDGQRNVAALINARYAHPIPVWVPERELESFYWIRDVTTPDDVSESVDGVPREVVVTISYTDDSGKTSYKDRFPLNIRELEGQALPVKTRTTTGSTVPDVACRRHGHSGDS